MGLLCAMQLTWLPQTQSLDLGSALKRRKTKQNYIYDTKMSILPVHFRDFKSLLKTLSSPSGDNRSTTMNEMPDVEQAQRQELGHRHRQQQHCGGGEGTKSIICQ